MTMKDPEEWKSGDDPATPAQKSYLDTLTQQTGEDVPDGLTKAAASERIDEMRAKAGLGDDATSTNDDVDVSAGLSKEELPGDATEPEDPIVPIPPPIQR